MLELFLNALPSIISAAVIFVGGGIWKMLKSAEAQRKKGQDEIKGHVSELKDMVEGMQKQLNEVKGITGDMLRDRLYYVLRSYEEQGFCPLEARDSLQKLYDDYRVKLHGNGNIERMFKRVCALPYDEPKGETCQHTT